jgi:hypothetical protein
MIELTDPKISNTAFRLSLKIVSVRPAGWTWFIVYIPLDPKGIHLCNKGRSRAEDEIIYLERRHVLDRPRLLLYAAELDI